MVICSSTFVQTLYLFAFVQETGVSKTMLHNYLTHFNGFIMLQQISILIVFLQIEMLSIINMLVNKYIAIGRWEAYLQR